MSCPKILKQDDGNLIVVDQFSGKRFPPDEEQHILAVVEQTAQKDASAPIQKKQEK